MEAVSTDAFIPAMFGAAKYLPHVGTGPQNLAVQAKALTSISTGSDSFMPHRLRLRATGTWTRSPVEEFQGSRPGPCVQCLRPQKRPLLNKVHGARGLFGQARRPGLTCLFCRHSLWPIPPSHSRPFGLSGSYVRTSSTCFFFVLSGKGLFPGTFLDEGRGRPCGTPMVTGAPGQPSLSTSARLSAKPTKHRSVRIGTYRCVL